jgi:hypothetical protein
VHFGCLDESNLMVVVWGGKKHFGSDDLHRCGKIQPPHSHGAGKSSHGLR